MDHDGENAGAHPVTEGTDLPALVESLLESRMATERTRFTEALAAERVKVEEAVASATASEKRIEEMLHARRKTVAAPKLQESAPADSADLTPDDFAEFARQAGYSI